ncbi:hypothetical protein [Streptomyces fungicidicus]|uniref:Uncharacterized protein n=1 Tax=Streptomyces fungicidicus TaxID=68203 RepID=A0ACC7Y7R6_9ACTN|nr:hypothetical protein [Streptomyces fungicidicus]NUV77824.1 hypothetical protein [Streptomyces fungicidicus]
MDFQESFDYLVEYARSTFIAFDSVWDCVEEVAGFGAPFGNVRRISIDLVSVMIDSGVTVGYLSKVSGQDLIPWGGAKSEILAKIDWDIERVADPCEFINICWFIVDRGCNSNRRIHVDSAPPAEASFAFWVKGNDVDLHSQRAGNGSVVHFFS